MFGSGGKIRPNRHRELYLHLPTQRLHSQCRRCRGFGQPHCIHRYRLRDPCHLGSQLALGNRLGGHRHLLVRSEYRSGPRWNPHHRRATLHRQPSHRPLPAYPQCARRWPDRPHWQYANHRRPLLSPGWGRQSGGRQHSDQLRSRRRKRLLHRLFPSSGGPVPGQRRRHRQRTLCSALPWQRGFGQQQSVRHLRHRVLGRR